MVLPRLEAAVIALSVCQMQMAVAFKDVIYELSLVLELCSPEGASPSLSDLVLSLEFMLATELPALSVVSAIAELAAVVLLLILYQNAVTVRPTHLEIPQIRQSLSIELAVATSEVILVQSAPINTSFLSQLVAVVDLRLMLTPQLLDSRWQFWIERCQRVKIEQFFALTATSKYTSHRLIIMIDDKNRKRSDNISSVRSFATGTYLLPEIVAIAAVSFQLCPHYLFYLLNLVRFTMSGKQLFHILYKLKYFQYI